MGYLKTYIYYREDTKIWYICDVHTGFKFAQATKRNKVVEYANGVISKVGRKEFLKTILRSVRNYGKIPKPYRYREEV